MQFDHLCPKTQQCLFLSDDTIANLQIFSLLAYPLQEDEHNEFNPDTMLEYLDSAAIRFDDHSELNILGIGHYETAIDIANYLAIPNSKIVGIVKGTNITFENIDYIPAQSALTVLFYTDDHWFHANLTQRVRWKSRWQFYSCSMMQRFFNVALPPLGLKAFSESSAQNTTVADMCTSIMAKCVGQHQQYDNYTACVQYLGSLPHHDPRCMGKFGQYNAMGQSLQCKYLHHFMTDLQPELHCYHVGPGKPDVKNHSKCVPQDCDVKDSSQPLPAASTVSCADSSVKSETPRMCSKTEMEELATATLYALQFCLPALQTGDCSFSNCTQAINTYLGRFVKNDVICKCAGYPPPSKLLQALQINVGVLLRTCPSSMLESPPCLGDKQETNDLPCSSDPQSYRSIGGCLKWDWSKFESILYEEWSEMNTLFSFQTKDAPVAEAQCALFSAMLRPYWNVHDESIMERRLASQFPLLDIFPSPHYGPIVTLHDKVVNALRASQRRDFSGAHYGMCYTGRWDYKSNNAAETVMFPTGSEEHRKSRKFQSLLYSGLTQQVFEEPKHKYLTGDEEDVYIQELLVGEISKALYGTKTELIEGWNEKMRVVVFETGHAAYLNNEFHRAHGYTLATSFMFARQSLARKMRKLFTDQQMQSFIDTAELTANLTLTEAFNVAASHLSVIPLFKTAFGIFKFIRRDPCKLAPLWEKSPARFILEYSRLYPAVTGFRASMNDGSNQSSSYYSIAAANLDPNVFPDPLKFDPSRDLSKVVTFNGLESDFDKGDPETNRQQPGSSLRRYCIGKSFTVRALSAIMPAFIPSTEKCANGVRKLHGTNFKIESITLPSSINLEVYKAEGTAAANDLIVAVHGFPHVPLQWAQFYSKLPAGYSMWAPALPGWGK